MRRHFVRANVQVALLAALTGALCGLASALFLISLSWATRFRELTPALVWALPLAGMALSAFYQRFAGDAKHGNTLIFEELNAPADHAARRIPRRMAPLILAATVYTHLFGGSAGREGTALQMGASLADGLRQALGLDSTTRRLLLLAGLSGGFGSVFGTPLAGTMFAIEAPVAGRYQFDAVLPCLISAFTGHAVTTLLGIEHAHYPQAAAVALELPRLLGVALAGVLCGLCSLLFIETLSLIKRALGRVQAPVARPLIAGAAIVALSVLLDTHDYLGLGLPLIERAFVGEVAPWVFALKLLFTAITLGGGFVGGEVTPLFVIGATLGHALGAALGIDPAWLAMLGFIAVFAGASNTPAACVLMGFELFGGASIGYMALICALAYLASGRRSIYAGQVLHKPAFTPRRSPP